jgi:putative transposase
MYSIPVSDPRVNELITWYLGALQRAVDVIWENIEWRYRFPKVEERKGKLRVKVPVSLKSPSYQRTSPSRGGFVTSSY